VHWGNRSMCETPWRKTPARATVMAGMAWRLMGKEKKDALDNSQRGGNEVPSIGFGSSYSSKSGHSARSSDSSSGRDEALWRRSKTAKPLEKQQCEVFVSEGSVWQEYLRRRRDSQRSETPRWLPYWVKKAQPAEPAVGASNRTVLHAGRGGAGWRKETAGCTGRRSKCKVRRSNTCSLCSTASAMVFILDGECITLSAKSMLNIKGARVELVQPDGMHLWLWNVASDALCSVQEAFARMRQAGVVREGDAQVAGSPVTAVDPDIYQRQHHHPSVFFARDDSDIREDSDVHRESMPENTFYIENTFHIERPHSAECAATTQECAQDCAQECAQECASAARQARLATISQKSSIK